MELAVLVFVLLIIALAKAFGEAVSRVGQPPIVGELLAGIVLGPFLLGAVFGQLQSMYDSKFLSDLADLGMLFLMLYVGMEFSAKLMKASSWRGGMIAASGVALPVALGVCVGIYFHLGGPALAFVAVAVAVTALPVTIRILKDLEVMKTRTAGVIISAALMTDIVLLLALGIILGTDQGSKDLLQTVYLGASFVVFFGLAILVGRYVAPHVYKLLKRMRTGEAAFAVAVGFAIAFAVLAEWAGLPGVIGAFIAGLLLRETGMRLKVWAHVEDILSGLTVGFLAPIFFVLIGFTVKFDQVANYLPLFGALLAVAIFGKAGGSYIASRLTGLGPNESVAIGSMMMGKGAMELVFARLAFEQGLIGDYLFSLLVLMAFVSTMLAPVFFKMYYNRAVASNEIPADAVEEGIPELEIEAEVA